MGFALLRKDRFYGWITLSVVAVVSALAGGGAVSSFGAFLPSICRDFGWGRALVSGAFTLLMVLMSVSSPIAGFLVEKLGPKKVLIIGSLSSAAGLLFLSFHTKVWQFYVGYGILMGLGAGLGGTVPAATIANNWFRKKIGAAMGITLASVGLGGLIVIPIVMLLIDSIGWRPTYLVLCGLMVLLGVIVPAFLIVNRPEELGQVPDGIASSGPSPDAMPHLDQSDYTLKEAMQTKSFWLLIIAQAMMVFPFTMLMAHEVAFLRDIGIGAAPAASVLGLLLGINTFGNLVLGFLTLKIDLKKLRLTGMFLLLVAMILVLLTRSLPMAFTHAIIFGFGYGAAMVTVMSLLSTYFGRTHYPALVGALMLFSAVGNVGSPIAGAIYDATKSYNIAFTIGIVAAVVGILCMILVKAPTRRLVMNNEPVTLRPGVEA